MKKHEYWLEQDVEDICSRLMEFHDHWTNWNGAPFKQMWLRNYIAYYSSVLHPGSWDTSLIFEGVQGELVRFYTPKARTLIRQLTSIVTKQRLSFKASAYPGSGSSVMNQVKMANAISAQIVTEQQLDLKSDQLCEGGLVCGLWFTKTAWRTDLGEKYITDDEGNPIRNGNVEIVTLSPFNVFWNTSLPWDQQSWVECRVKRNRWDLIAEHPDIKDEILSIPSVTEQRGPHNWVDNQLPDDDLIYVYEFYHKPTPSVPKGKMLIYADQNTVFHHGPNIYGCIPIEANIPELALDTGLGYSKLTDLMGCQEMFDNSLSAIATNQSAFAVQNVVSPRGANVNVNELNGMNFIEFTPMQGVSGGGKPEALNLSQTSPETFKFTDKLEQLMQQLSLLEGLAGSLPPGVTSGTAIATLTANSLEFITGIAKGHTMCIEKTMMHAINAFQKFAKTPHKVILSQKDGQQVQKDFVGEDIKDVSNIKLETTNVLMQNMAGRLEVGEKLISMPKEAWPEYTSIIEGRPFSEIYKDTVTETDLIAQENEALENGQEVPVLATDDHPRHIKEQAALLADVNVRQNGQVVQAVLDHIMEHYKQMKQGDPALLAIIKTGMVPEGGLQPPPRPPQQSTNPATMMSGAPPVDQPMRDAPAEVQGDIAQPTPDPLGRGQ